MIDVIQHTTANGSNLENSTFLQVNTAHSVTHRVAKVGITVGRYIIIYNL